MVVVMTFGSPQNALALGLSHGMMLSGFSSRASEGRPSSSAGDNDLIPFLAS